MKRSRSKIKGTDWFTVILYLLLVTFGWMNILAANIEPNAPVSFDFSTEYTKQLIWIGISFLTIGVIYLIDSKFYAAFAGMFYIITTVMLIMVIFVGVEINAAKAWFEIAGMRFQPIELAKVSTSLMIAHTLSRTQFSFTKLQNILIAFAIIIIPLLITILQNDLGSGLVLLAIVITFFREGLSPFFIIAGIIAIIIFILTMIIPNHLIILALTAAFIIALLFYKQIKSALISLLIIAISYSLVTQVFYNDATEMSNNIGVITGIAAASLFIAARVFLKRQSHLIIYIIMLWGSIGFTYTADYIFEEMLGAYQQNRIMVMIGLKDDPHGAGYNVNQSKIAIGSGGVQGKGFMEGTQTKFDFVPEQTTDFIFCTVGEEWGFIGTSAVIIAFITLLLRLIYLSERQYSSFSRIYGYSVVSILFFHIIVNIGMTIGLAPVIGIPLPFFSYGGSALWGFTILLFIFLKLDTNRAELLR
ncbi:rod shape-determining protein RodA [Marinilabiliaceae bacterium ANBcel2]|nr:rod shape-determining protein RodA [Marinilabiliaceae bacterium ANBcel2]